MNKLLLPLAMGCLSCATVEERFELKYAPDFTGSSMTVSVFGVLQDGLMIEDAPALLAPSIFQVFHQETCDIAYGERLARLNPALFSHIDREAKDNGITDQLLEKVASHAGGDFIVAFEMSGRPPGRSERTSSAKKPIMLAHGGDMGGPGVVPRHEPKPTRTFDVTTLVFSVRAHRIVARVTMAYSGASVADAMAKLSVRLGSEFPGARCAEWKLPAAAPSSDESTPPAANSHSRAVL